MAVVGCGSPPAWYDKMWRLLPETLAEPIWVPYWLIIDILVSINLNCAPMSLELQLVSFHLASFVQVAL